MPLSAPPISDVTSQALQGVADGEWPLPAWCYRDEAHHHAELKTLFDRGWTAIGFASEVASPGQLLPRSILGRPLLISRDAKDTLHVFDNVCRHRGHLLVETPCSKRKLLVCPYHAWSYALDGRLVQAPYWNGEQSSAPGPELKQQLSLRALSVVVWYDILFVDLSGYAPPFPEWIAPLEDRWRKHYDPAWLQPFSLRHFSMAGNWKLVAENFLDNYHLPWIHPQVGGTIETALGLKAENLHPVDYLIGFSLHGAGNEKKKTRKPLPYWPDLDEAGCSRQELLFLFPNICLVMEGNYLWSMVLLPTSASTCDEIVSLNVVGEAAMQPEQDESRTQLADTIHEINEQDNAVVRGLQAGRQGDAASFGVFNPHHDQLGIWLHQYIASAMLQQSSE